jgi:uncharacterized DUF497 family protein
VRHFSWNPEKNEKLKAERYVSFEDVVYSMEHDLLLDIVEHPNRSKYPNQGMFVVRMNDYVYLVPFVESEEGAFLKTIIPSRKATKRYTEEGARKDG